MSSFEVPRKVFKLLAGFEKPWFVAGGWAVDLFLGKVTREHEDIEIAIFRCDQLTLRNYLNDWEFKKVIPEPKMHTELWKEDEWLDLPVHEIHAENSSSEISHLEILLNESSNDEWRFRRNPIITRPISMLGTHSENGIPFLNPEIVLLYKAKNPNPWDEADFENIARVLDRDRKSWLKQVIQTCYPGHSWINIL
ncbi:MAG: hypothetical protein WBD28_11320 [Candidatus Zixiibacteriota bacterium]